MIGGCVGLAGAIVLGPRIGKFNKDGSANTIPGHNITIGILGTIILFFGWFGFNPGSSLGFVGAFRNLAVIAAVNTLLAGARWRLCRNDLYVAVWSIQETRCRHVREWHVWLDW